MIIGIDLGTTNSLVAVWKEGAPVLIPNALGVVLTPSCVGFSDSGELLIGQAAKDRLQTHPKQTIANFKRYMGSARECELGKRKFRPEEVSSFVLRSLKADAEAFLGETVQDAIISVPAYFSDAQRKATRAAGQLAGLRVERLVNEPTAAALAYGVRDAGSERKFLVFDLGGGTFDVSVLEIFEGVMEVRASAGDNFLGGEDFLDILVEDILASCQSELCNNDLSPGDRQRLREAAEKMKRTLSAAPLAELSLRLRGKNISYSLNEDRYIELCDPLLQRLRIPVERALRDARIRASDLYEIVLAGGATRMPIVRKLVTRMFGRFPVTTLNPDEVVALGVAVQAGLAMDDVALDEIVMTDVCPYTLGINTSQQLSGPGGAFVDGFYLPIIERNTVVPASRSKDVYTVRDGQPKLGIDVYQGEARLVKENIPLGKFVIDMPPGMPAGGAGANVRFTYDVNGLLEVEATVHGTNIKGSIVIEEHSGVLSNDEIRERLDALASLKLHPREDVRNAALMARGNRLFEEALGPARMQISRALAQFESILGRQEPHEIATAREQFQSWLDSFESSPLIDA
ncbi:molecular chaperone HscC [Rhodanobacter sp. C05]|uniref:Hsp70 family protein n=1 Tax=Rhodanobacter sp. C05 TaxID=1945855 RepID=UPI00098732A0|nr:molecular chaperone HscC [Rhodanobacter sp. C05]OOG38733.1 molecular chaperone HscC [Rhodanobacter sp. C05]